MFQHALTVSALCIINKCTKRTDQVSIEELDIQNTRPETYW